MEQGTERPIGRQPVVIPIDSTKNPHQALRSMAEEWGTDLQGAIGMLMNRDGNVQPFIIGTLQNQDVSWMLSRLNYLLQRELHHGDRLDR